MSAELFMAAIGAPLMLGITGLFIFFVTRWSDRRDRLRGN